MIQIVRKITSICFCFTLIDISAQSNPCPTKNLSDYPGTWKPRSSYRGVGPAQKTPPAGTYNKVIAGANLDKLLVLAKNAYPEPKGGNAYFTKLTDPRILYKWEKFGYKLYIGHSSFVCTAGQKITESVETGVYLEFYVNNFSDFVSPVGAPTMNESNLRYFPAAKDDDTYTIGGKRVFRIPINHISSNSGMDQYTEKIYGNNEPRERWFILRKENVPLFRYITRKEYIIQFKEEIRLYKNEYIQYVKTNYQKHPEAMQSTFDWLPKFEANAEKLTRRIDEYLQNSSTEELNKPMAELIHYGILFNDDPKLRFLEDRFHLVFINEDYFDLKKPVHIPQLIIVKLSSPPANKNPEYAWRDHFRNSIINGLDMKAISSMINN